MCLTTQNGALTELEFAEIIRCDAPVTPDLHTEADKTLLDETERQLGEYFACKRKTFDLPLAVKGTPFRSAVWDALRRIPYGEVATYGEIAREVGSPGAARAVGGACNANPIAIIIPCHRVVGANGALTGFGGGLDVKAMLLGLEKTK